MLTVDARERLLMEVLRTGGIAHRVATLPVGDVTCEYEDGTSWLAERKRTDDLANCIKSGRWSEQVSRLVEVGSPIFIFEGDLRNACLPYESMVGAVVNCELRDDMVVFRTWDVNETAYLVQHLVHKMYSRRPLGISLGNSKRKRVSDLSVCWMRQLMCIPSISENVARKLLKEFGSLSQLQDALRSAAFPRIRLDERTCLGQARRAKLAEYLLGTRSDYMNTDRSVSNSQLAVPAPDNSIMVNRGKFGPAHNSMDESNNHLIVPAQHKVNCSQTSANTDNAHTCWVLPAEGVALGLHRQ